MAFQTFLHRRTWLVLVSGLLVACAENESSGVASGGPGAGGGGASSAVTTGGAAGQPCELEPSGTLDSAFGTDGIVRVSVPDSREVALAVQSDGKILVGHGDTVSRLTPDGAPDASFGTAGNATLPVGAQGEIEAIVIQPDETIVVGVRAYVARLDAAGALDAAFGDAGIAPSPPSYDVAVQADGKIVVAGERPPSGGFGREGVIGRLEQDGSPDLTFGTGGEVSYSNGSSPLTRFHAVVVWNNRILAAGHDTAVNALVFAVTESGAPDMSFSGDGLQSLPLGRSQSDIYELELDVSSDNPVYAGFYRDSLQTGNGTAIGSIAAPDSGKFVAPGVSDGAPAGLRVLADGGLVFATSHSHAGGTSDIVLFHTDKMVVLDPEFGMGGRATLDLPTEDVVTDAVVTPGEETIVVAGTASDEALDTVEVIVARFVLRRCQ